MANYTDGLSDLDLNEYINNFRDKGKIASFLAVQPSQSFHLVEMGENDEVNKIEPVKNADMWINAGFFVFRREIFDYMKDGEELVMDPFYRLIGEKQLIAYRHTSFWACMDTFKEKKMFDDLYARGEMPWAVWEPGRIEEQERNGGPAQTYHRNEHILEEKVLKISEPINLYAEPSI
jgi:glucose-1-phosphate cytidylyltransferase